eukprot:1488029-Pleurochrysis_carterae.AAC.3
MESLRRRVNKSHNHSCEDQFPTSKATLSIPRFGLDEPSKIKPRLDSQNCAISGKSTLEQSATAVIWPEV